MKELEEKLEYHFKNQSYLKTALTHSSQNSFNALVLCERGQGAGRQQ
ncbi:MAG: hypothetical protein K0Q85_1067 [Caproiciproducens sp.]|nr:hypothetical protein [Caproiciproducens sp.]